MRVPSGRIGFGSSLGPSLRGCHPAYTTSTDCALRVPYSARAAGVSLWIKAGVDPLEVARRAGHSIAVLFRFYAKILRGNQSRSNQLIAKELEAES